MGTIQDLPTELWLMSLDNLSNDDLFIVAKTCSDMRDMAQRIWKTRIIRYGFTISKLDEDKINFLIASSF